MRFNRNYSLTVVVLFFIHCAPGFAQVVSLPPAPIDSFPYSPLRRQKPAREQIVESPIDAPSYAPISVSPQWNFGRTIKLRRIRPILNPGGWTNDCSQYAVAAVLSAAGIKADKALYDDIGRSINPKQTGSSNVKINNYLKRYFDTRATWNANGNQLHHHINRGFPAVVTVEITPKTSHAIIVYGIETGSHGERLKWLIEDNGLLRGKMTNIQFLEKWKLPSDSRNANHCIFISPKRNSPKPPPLLAANPYAPLSFSLTVEQKLALYQVSSNSEELAKLREELDQVNLQVAALQRPKEPQCPQPIEGPPIPLFTPLQELTVKTLPDELIKLRAQLRQLTVDMVELRKAKVTTPASSQVPPDTLAAIEKLNEQQRQLTAQMEAMKLPQGSTQNQGMIPELGKTIPKTTAATATKKPTLAERYYAWRGSPIGIQIGETLTTKPTFFDAIAERFKEAKAQAKSYFGSSSFEAPATATVAIATLSSLIVLPLLFIVVHAINGKWLKM